MEAVNTRLPSPLTQDFPTAELFVRTIAGNAPVSFRLYTDKKGKKSSLSFTGSLDALWDRLASENNRGMAVCMTINGASNGGLEAQDVDRIRAVFVDLDGAPLAPVLTSALQPHFINETSTGR